MPGYNFATLLDAVTALQGRLYESTSDTSQQLWTVAELSAYLTEALRVFNALTSFWRKEFVFNLRENVQWYDITVEGGSLRAYTVTQDDLVTLIEYHLLEPLTDTYPLAWTGSDQFALSDILGALTRRQNDTLGATGCTVTRGLVVAPIAPGRIFLPDNVIDIRRIAWLPVDQNDYPNTILRQSDPWAKRAFDFTWTVAAPEPPENWLQVTEPPPSFDVDRTPPVVGQYEVMSVNSGPNFTGTQPDPATLTVPDDWTWVLKYGAMMDLFGRESNSKDELRAAYCKRRYEDGIAMLTNAPAVLNIRINDIPFSVDAVRNGDDFNSTWQSADAGEPESVYASGLNMLAFGPPPDDGGYSVTASVVMNAPIPASLGDSLQVSRENYDSIIDYAHHLALLKVGGQELMATVPLYKKFLDRCAVYNAKLREMGQFEIPMSEISQLEEERRPRMAAVSE